MKKSILIVLVILILGFLGYRRNAMFKMSKGVFEDSKHVELIQEENSDRELKIVRDSIASIDIKEVLLTENKLNNINLDKLNDKNIIQILKSVFPEFSIKEETGQQDEPDFKLYQVKSLEEELFSILYFYGSI